MFLILLVSITLWNQINRRNCFLPLSQGLYAIWASIFNFKKKKISKFRYILFFNNKHCLFIYYYYYFQLFWKIFTFNRNTLMIQSVHLRILLYILYIGKWIWIMFCVYCVVHSSLIYLKKKKLVTFLEVNSIHQTQ